jgi:ribosomal protein S18 acetylase RimI-like enzyme
MKDTIIRASAADLEEILALQRLAYQLEAELYQDWTIPPLVQTLSELKEEFQRSVMLKAILQARIIGSVRAVQVGNSCHIGRLIVHPEFQRRGYGTALLAAIEGEFPDLTTFCLFTGSKSTDNIRLYQNNGYIFEREEGLSPSIRLVHLVKQRPASGKNGSCELKF